MKNMASHLIRVLLIDDEEAACVNLENIIRNYIKTPIEIVGIANDTIQAERLIHELKPDAVFIDIEMPGENAFQFLDRISPLDFEVIFVTAYDEYAMKAFKLNALDYILKPISIEELNNAVNKLCDKLTSNRILNQLGFYRSFSQQLNDKTESTCITFRTQTSIEIVNFADIHFIEAQGSYSKVMYQTNNAQRNLTLSHPISEYEEILPKEIFFRTHKSYIVNLNLIERITNDNGSFVTLGNVQIPVSRRRYAELVLVLNNGTQHKSKTL